MACDLTLGRKEVCKDSVGGIKAIYFSNFEDTTTASYTFDSTNTDVIDAVSGTPNVYKYEVRDASSFTQNRASCWLYGKAEFLMQSSFAGGFKFFWYRAFGIC